MSEQSTNSEKLIKESINSFVQQVDGLADAAPVVKLVLDASVSHSQKRLDALINNNVVEKKKNDDGSYRVVMQSDAIAKVIRASKKCGASAIARQLVSRSFLVALISQYDAFLGNLIRFMYSARPEMLRGSERTMTYSQLCDFSCLDDACKAIVDKEVEAVLRKNHADQISWLETKLDILLTQDVANWPEFIEITERRNLFVHTDGRVSDQYLSNCKKHKVKFGKERATSDVLECDGAYLRRARAVVFEIGVKLGHTMWRKLLKSDIEAADFHLNTIAYELIKRHEYDLAITILQFGLNQKRHFSEKSRLFFLINLAQAYKWSGNDARCHELLGAEDWDARSNDLLLAATVLKNEFDEALRVMEEIGANSENVDTGSYREWPVFREFRKDPRFAEKFENLFHEKLVIQEENEEIQSLHDLSEYVVNASVSGSESSTAPVKEPVNKSHN